MWWGLKAFSPWILNLSFTVKCDVCLFRLLTVLGKRGGTQNLTLGGHGISRPLSKVISFSLASLLREKERDCELTCVAGRDFRVKLDPLYTRTNTGQRTVSS